MYEVVVWTNANPAGNWCEALVWKGDSLTKALWHFRKAKRESLGVYVTLRWG